MKILKKLKLIYTIIDNQILLICIQFNKNFSYLFMNSYYKKNEKKQLINIQNKSLLIFICYIFKKCKKLDLKLSICISNDWLKLLK
jgi:hypothetical protein